MEFETSIAPVETDPFRLQTLGLMTAGIAHDLGNMIQVTLRAVSVIERSAPVGCEHDLGPLVTIARASLERAGALTRRLLGFANPGIQFNVIVAPKVALAEIVDLLRWVVGPTVEVAIDVRDPLPNIACDMHDFENVLLNLVINARDAMPKGGRIDITLQKGGGPDDMPLLDRDHLVIRVADTGCGMSRETIHRAFEPFFTTKQEGSGTGLGLSTVRSFVSRLDGSVEIESAVGTGTVVTLRLPRPVHLPCRAGNLGRGTNDVARPCEVDEGPMVEELVMSELSPPVQGITIETADDSSLAARLDAVIEAAVTEERIVGAVVLVARDGETVYRRSIGFLDRENRRAMHADAIFRFASLTKPIVSAAALSLVETCEIKLDDPINKYVPEFRPRLPSGELATITVRELMTHTAGMSYGFLQPDDGPYHLAKVSDGLDQPGLSMSENLRRIASVPLKFAPGSAWGYSVATDVLGEVMARAAGMSLPQVVRKRVTGPLGMNDSDFVLPPTARLATPYGDDSPRPRRMDDPHRVRSVGGNITYSPRRIHDAASFPSGGAGMAGTASDFLCFLEVLRRGGQPILERASVHAMTHNATGALPVDLMGPGWGYGLGVAVLKEPDLASTPQSAGTWHWSGAYGHYWFVDPARKLTVVALSNTAIAGMFGAYPDAIRDAVYASE